jgi:hypothetical protein
MCEPGTPETQESGLGNLRAAKNGRKAHNSGKAQKRALNELKNLGIEFVRMVGHLFPPVDQPSCESDRFP